MQDLTASVLVVDDHEPARASIAEILRHAGHTVACAASAAEALGKLEASPDVILTDLQMPGMNGLEIIRVLAQRGEPADAQRGCLYGVQASAVCGAIRLAVEDFPSIGQPGRSANSIRLWAEREKLAVRFEE